MDHVEIPLSRGLFALVSLEDAPHLTPYKWHAVKAGHTFYAARRTQEKTIYMHRAILGVVQQGREVFVDHRNHHGLDNRRENIHTCTQSQNARNRRDQKSFLKVTGVAFEKCAWVARIGVNGRQVYLGSFPCEREAGIAYEAAKKVLNIEISGEAL